MTDYGFLEQVKAGKCRNEYLGVHICPSKGKVYNNIRPRTRVKAYGVPVTNAEQHSPVGSIACYQSKKLGLIPCKIEEYRHNVGKAVISVDNGRAVKIVSQDFIRPLKVLTKI